MSFAFGFLLRLFRSFIARDRVQKYRLGIYAIPGIAVQDEAFIHASWASDAFLDQFVDNIVRKSHLDGTLVDLRIFLLSVLLLLFKLFRNKLFHLFPDHVTEFALDFLGFADHFANCQMGDTIALREKLGEVRLTGAWWASNEHFQREKASEEVELIVEEFHVCTDDTAFAVPVIDREELGRDIES